MAFSDHYGFTVRLCYPNRPQTKGKVENSIKFIRIRNALRYRNGPIPLNSKHNLSEMDLERGRIKLDWLISIIDGGSHSSGEKELRRTLLSVKRDLTERRV